MHEHFRSVSWRPTKNGTSEIFKGIKPSKQERIQSVLPKPDCLACLYIMPSSAIEIANITSAIYKMEQSSVGR